jgi:hypothetical protein
VRLTEECDEARTGAPVAAGAASEVPAPPLRGNPELRLDLLKLSELLWRQVASRGQPFPQKRRRAGAHIKRRIGRGAAQPHPEPVIQGGADEGAVGDVVVLAVRQCTRVALDRVLEPVAATAGTEALDGGDVRKVAVRPVALC